MRAPRVASVAGRRDLKRSDPGRDRMKGAPHLGLEAAGARLALEAEMAPAPKPPVSCAGSLWRVVRLRTPASSRDFGMVGTILVKELA